MRPSEEWLEEFRRIYQRVYGKPIELDKAREMTTRLLTLYELFVRTKPEMSPRSSPVPDMSAHADDARKHSSVEQGEW